MFAVIKTGGKQYSVAAEDVITVMSLPGAPGDAVVFDDVLMLVGDGETKIGAPFLEGVKVAGASSIIRAAPRSMPSRKGAGRIQAQARTSSGPDRGEESPRFGPARLERKAQKPACAPSGGGPNNSSDIGICGAGVSLRDDLEPKRWHIKRRVVRLATDATFGRSAPRRQEIRRRIRRRRQYHCPPTRHQMAPRRQRWHRQGSCLLCSCSRPGGVQIQIQRPRLCIGRTGPGKQNNGGIAKDPAGFISPVGTSFSQGVSLASPIK